MIVVSRQSKYLQVLKSFLIVRSLIKSAALGQSLSGSQNNRTVELLLYSDRAAAPYTRTSGALSVSGILSLLSFKNMALTLT